MDNEYVKRALEVRKNISKLTLDQQKELLKLYEGVIEDLASNIGKVKSKTLSERWLKDRQKEFTKARKILAKDIEKQVEESLYKSAVLGTQVNEQMMMDIFSVVGIDPGNHFSTAFSVIQDDVMKDIISGDLYSDHSTLSKRIWNFTDKSGKDLQYLLQKGVLEGKSALELARDVEEFVKDPAKRPWSWGKVYPNLRNTKIDYNAQRLSRTMINHSYQTSSIKSCGMNPFVEGIEWMTSKSHNTVCEICKQRAIEDKFGLGVGIFPKDNVPLDHPNGHCTMLPYITKSLDEVADELKDWLDGGNNPALDEWYNEHGDYFAGISRANDTNNPKSGIIKSKKLKTLKKIKSQNWAKQIKDKDKTELFKYLDNTTEEELQFWSNYGDLIQGDFYDESGSYYSPLDKTIHLCIDEIDERNKRIGDTKNNRVFFHETGHLFDDNVIKASKGIRIVDELTKIKTKIEVDYLNYSNVILKSKGEQTIKSFSKLSTAQKNALIEDLNNDPHLKNAISDIVEGMTNARVHGMYGHGKDYWKRENALEKEVIAHMFEAKMIKGERIEVFQKYFPDAFEYFDNYITRLVAK